MAMVDLGIPPGFDVDSSAFETMRRRARLPNLKSRETRSSSICGNYRTPRRFSSITRSAPNTRSGSKRRLARFMSITSQEIAPKAKQQSCRSLIHLKAIVGPIPEVIS